jgi:hypothetical protein
MLVMAISQVSATNRQWGLAVLRKVILVVISLFLGAGSIVLRAAKKQHDESKKS